MELMDTNLHQIISKNKHVFDESHIKCLMKQLLEGIKAMHMVGVYHRDIKPANILVNRDCQLRITDFGLARHVANSNWEIPLPMTEYVVTRWYRAPELLLATSEAYSESIDIWSAGCIMAEMFLRKPLFPGQGFIDQVRRIFSIIGLRDPNRDLGFPISEANYSFLISRCLSAGLNIFSRRLLLYKKIIIYVNAHYKENPFPVYFPH